MNKTLFLCIIFLLLQGMSESVFPATADSLIRVIKTQQDDTGKVSNLNELAWEYMSAHDYTRAEKVAGDALVLARKIQFRRGEATALRRLGGIAINNGRYTESLKYYNEELKIQEDLGDRKRLPSSYMQIGSVFFYFGNYPSALENYLKGLRIAEENKDLVTICKISNNIGALYLDTKEYGEALKYYSSALKIYEEMGDKAGIAKECCGIGSIYYEQKNFTDALIYFRKSLSISEENGLKRLAATCYIDIGELYTTMGNYDEALKNQFRALKIAQEISDPYITVNAERSIGWTYFNTRDWSNSRKYMNNALGKAKETGLIDGIKACYLNLSSLDSTVGNYNSSLENYKLYIFYRDSILSSENANKIAQQRMQYEFDKTQKLEKAEQAKKDLRQSIIRYAILGCLLIATVFLFIVFRQRNKIRREKKTSEDERTRAEAAKINAEKERQRAEAEKERSDELLLNILPAEVADEIKRVGHSKAKTFSMVTVMFTDFKDFTTVSESYSAELLVDEIDYCFSAFDQIIRKYGVEKIKTIGDAYMCVGGMPVLTTTHATDVINAAIEIRDFMLERKKSQDAKGGIAFELRLGIHTGPVVAGIVGLNKYAYDIWGNTVNLAARMEQTSEAGKINISQTTHKLVRDKFNCTYRGKILAKNAGEIEMYFVEKRTIEADVSMSNVQYPMSNF